ncbi:tail fiber assembly protein [Escherichia coli]|nr:tail fiber assembly protein [Escherichia coli]EGF8263848.1 tail fiber assembly protein [Escherichia coli]EGG0915243.1 tail fiber assembly protein [Escherichia coli]EGK3929354.1 tail fiber assembly protein [Escherichia coli]EHE2750566.1 tail fiber assembly protein [Escherichia coli]
MEIATEEEKALLAAWKTYRVLLMRVDTVNPSGLHLRSDSPTTPK